MSVPQFGSIEVLHFETSHAPTIAAPLPGLPPWVYRFASMVRTASSEGKALSVALGFLAAIRMLAPAKARRLLPLLRESYREMRKDDGFRRLSSAVPYCFATARHSRGHAFLSVPANASAASPTILLLHGFGGNLLFQMHAITRELPEAVVVAPSWQLSWSDGPLADRLGLLHDAISAVSAKLGFKLRPPCAIGISQGGVAAFELLDAAPALCSSLLGISTGASLPLAPTFPKIPVAMAHGTLDDHIAPEDARATVAALLDRGMDVKFGEVSDADHYLLLSHRAALGRFMRSHLAAALGPA